LYIYSEAMHAIAVWSSTIMRVMYDDCRWWKRIERRTYVV